MKLESLALTAIVLAAMSNACAYGADSPGRRPGGAAQSGIGVGEGGTGAGGDAGAYSYGTPDSGNPFTTPDTGSVLATDTGATTPPFDSGAAPDEGTVTSCGAMGTMSGCAECCGTLNPTGVTTLNSAIQACACGAAGTCSAECASEVCADIPATSGDACYTCLSAALGTSGACYTSVQTTCVADPGCSAYLSCEMSECTGKP